MGKPIIKSGKFHAGTYLRCGENVVIDVAEEVVVGDRCVLPENAYLGGRRIQIGDDFFGYSWEWKRLDVGRGRKDDEHAVLTVGDRSTFHDNRIDLAAPVVVGDDVGLSPEVVLYCHYYWQSVLQGFPCKYQGVRIGNGTLVGFRSTILPGADIADGCVIGAGSVVSGKLTHEQAVYAGNPARLIRKIEEPSRHAKQHLLVDLMAEYAASRNYRGYKTPWPVDYPIINAAGTKIDVEARTLEGPEDEHTDDIRWFLFTRGVRIYTRRPFGKLGRKS